jgi:argininosuccinate lyase
VRGASGVLIGRLTGFLAVTKSPSARSDNFIFAYGEVPRALDLAVQVTELMSGVIRTLQVNPDRLREELDKGYAQSTDLAEHLTQLLDIDYRTAYFVVGDVVREASRAGIRGLDLTAQMINDAALTRTGARWRLADSDLRAVLDPSQIVASRRALGGTAAEPIAQMLQATTTDTAELAATAAARLAGFAAAEEDLVRRVGSLVDGVPDLPTDHPRPGGSP